MDRNPIVSARTELESIIRDAWKIAKEGGDPSDAETARTVEAKCRELLSLLPAPRPKRKASHKAKKRNAFKRCVRLDADAPILAQARSLVR